MKTLSLRCPAFLAVAAAVGVVTSIVACSHSSESPDSAGSDLSGSAVGQIRGVNAISDILRTRLLDDTDPRTAKFGVERVAGTGILGLRNQLGVFGPAGTQTLFQGGTPTPFNMALWHQLFARFGDAMGDFCTSGGTEVRFPAYTVQGIGQTIQADGGVAPVAFLLFPTVAQKITAACTFQGDAAGRSQTASALFDAVMGRGATLADEKTTFVTTFAADGSSFVTATPKERVSSMFVSMLLNPHFILSN